MKPLYTSILAVISFSFLISCNGEKKNQQEIDITQVTYKDFYEMMFEDYENRVEWHHDTYIDEAKAEIDLVEKGGCKTENCGNQIFVKNISTDKKILVVVNTSFSIPNSPDYLATKFILEPGSEKYLTCTQFCLNGETFKLDQEVVIAQYAID